MMRLALRKAYWPMVVTPSGMTTSPSRLRPSKALAPMVCSVRGKVKRRRGQAEKAEAGMAVTVASLRSR